MDSDDESIQFQEADVDATTEGTESVQFCQESDSESVQFYAESESARSSSQIQGSFAKPPGNWFFQNRADGQAAAAAAENSEVANNMAAGKSQYTPSGQQQVVTVTPASEGSTPDKDAPPPSKPVTAATTPAAPAVDSAETSTNSNYLQQPENRAAKNRSGSAEGSGSISGQKKKSVVQQILRAQGDSSQRKLGSTGSRSTGRGQRIAAFNAHQQPPTPTSAPSSALTATTAAAPTQPPQQPTPASIAATTSRRHGSKVSTSSGSSTNESIVRKGNDYASTTSSSGSGHSLPNEEPSRKSGQNDNNFLGVKSPREYDPDKRKMLKDYEFGEPAVSMGASTETEEAVKPHAEAAPETHDQRAAQRRGSGSKKNSGKKATIAAETVDPGRSTSSNQLKQEDSFCPPPGVGGGPDRRGTAPPPAVVHTRTPTTTSVQSQGKALRLEEQNLQQQRDAAQAILEHVAEQSKLLESKRAHYEHTKAVKESAKKHHHHHHNHHGHHHPSGLPTGQSAPPGTGAVGEYGNQHHVLPQPEASPQVSARGGALSSELVKARGLTEMCRHYNQLQQSEIDRVDAELYNAKLELEMFEHSEAQRAMKERELEVRRNRGRSQMGVQTSRILEEEDALHKRQVTSTSTGVGGTPPPKTKRPSSVNRKRSSSRRGSVAMTPNPMLPSHHQDPGLGNNQQRSVSNSTNATNPQRRVEHSASKQFGVNTPRKQDPHHQNPGAHIVGSEEDYVAFSPYRPNPVNTSEQEQRFFENGVALTMQQTLEFDKFVQEEQRRVAELQQTQKQEPERDPKTGKILNKPAVYSERVTSALLLATASTQGGDVLGAKKTTIGMNNSGVENSPTRFRYDGSPCKSENKKKQPQLIQKNNKDIFNNNSPLPPGVVQNSAKPVHTRTAIARHAFYLLDIQQRGYVRQVDLPHLKQLLQTDAEEAAGANAGGDAMNLSCLPGAFAAKGDNSRYCNKVTNTRSSGGCVDRSGLAAIGGGGVARFHALCRFCLDVVIPVIEGSSFDEVDFPTCSMLLMSELKDCAKRKKKEELRQQEELENGAPAAHNNNKNPSKKKSKKKLHDVPPKKTSLEYVELLMF